MSVTVQRLHFDRVLGGAINLRVELCGGAVPFRLSREAALLALGELWLAVQPAREEAAAVISAQPAPPPKPQSHGGCDDGE